MSLAPRPVMLAGREELLAELDARLAPKEQEDGPGLRIIALHGLGGVGKTSVAVEYAHRQLAETGLVWQFPAEDPTVLTAEFTRLAAQLGARDLLDARDPVASVHAVLAAYQARWLLVFDNSPDQGSVQRFLPPAGPGRVLITTQSALWPPGQAMDIPVLDQQVAAGFLTARTGDPNEEAAAELAGELGGLPLALEQAAAYLHATGGSIAGYLADYRKRRFELLARGEPAGYGKTAATTWALAFDRLEQANVHAAGLLRLLACCAPEPVPLPLLLQPRAWLPSKFGTDVAPVLVPLLEDALIAGDAIAAVRQYSLITTVGDGLVSMHRLVQAVTLGQIPEDLAVQWRQGAAAVIDAAIPLDTDSPETWPVCASLLPHAQAALAADSAGMARIANYLGRSGSYAAARLVLQRVCEARGRVRGNEHPSTLAARADLASWTGEAGDVTAARDQFAALLPVVERVLGRAHPQTLATRHNLVYWTEKAGDSTAAGDEYAALLRVQEQVLGPEHLDTLKTRALLAYWTGRAGDAAAARDQFAALLAMVERVLGTEHPYTLTTQASLARWTGEAGDAAAARTRYEALALARAHVLGPEHPNTLTTRASLAQWTGEDGDAAAARDQFAALLPVVERVFGPEHPDTLATRGSLARWTGEADKGPSIG